MNSKQRTLKSTIEFEGVGLHTGQKVNLKILPGTDNSGYQFQRIDLEGQPIVKADPDNVISTNRGTTLGKGEAIVHTTEHLLAALYGCKVDNALIQLDSEEVPIMDGSSQMFVDKIEEVGYEELSSDRKYLVLKENIFFEDNGTEMMAVPTNGGEFRITVMVDYNSPVLGTQHASMYYLNDFAKEIASCRTFVFVKELVLLAQNGLIKGGDLDNAIVLSERKYSKEEIQEVLKLIGRDDLEIEFSGIGVLNNIKLRYQNEPARHKLLDIVGDLALVGRFIRGHILAARPGHKGNVGFAKILKEHIKAESKKGFEYDLNKKPLYDINDISKLLPHRYPFLLIDKIMEMGEDWIIGVKNVTLNEPFFQGHFPNNPVMPGVLQIEAMAQIGGVFALSTVDEPERYSTYFMKIDDVKFKQKVLPGDTIVFKLELVSPIRRGLVNMKGVGYVGGSVVIQATMLAQIIKDR